MIILRWSGWLCSLIVLILALPVAAPAQGSPNSKLVEAAKKEGELVYYTTMTLDQSKAVVDRFEKSTVLNRNCSAPVAGRCSTRF